MGRPKKFPDLSDDDKVYISKYFHSKTPQEISRYLDKPPHVVDTYILSLLPKKPSYIDEELRGLPEWKYLKLEYTADELELFERLYTAYKDQFKDIVATERRQVLQLISLDISMHRIKLKQRRDTEDSARICKDIDEENYFKSGKPTNKARVDTLTNQLQTIRAAEGTYSRSYNDDLAKHSRILENLKGTRDQRIKVAENSRFSFPDLVKAITEQSRIDDEGKRIEIMRLAALKERERLSQYHQYLDGKIDRPLYNSDTVLLDDEEEIDEEGK